MPDIGREPLLRNLGVIRTSDAELRKILTEAAEDAHRTILNLGDGYANQVRRTQLLLAEQQIQLWRDVGITTRVGIGDAVDAAGDTLAIFDDLVLRQAGLDFANWRYAIMQQAREGIDSLTSRLANRHSLAETVYRNRQLSSGQVDRLVNSALLRGASARELASEVRRFIRPDVRGGVSYAAMRLGRTEINNAFHETTKRHWGESPFVTGQRWYLSGSHPRPDTCDDYANDTHYRGGNPGVYKPDNVPPKPHPNCFCFVAPVALSDAELLRKFRKGDFDDYCARMGCGVV